MTTLQRKSGQQLRCLLSAVLFLVAQPGRAADWANAGLLFDRFQLTLSSGNRTEALGPFISTEHTDSQYLWAVPPLISHMKDPAIDAEEFDLCYPILTYDRYG